MKFTVDAKKFKRLTEGAISVASAAIIRYPNKT